MKNPLKERRIGCGLIKGEMAEVQAITSFHKKLQPAIIMLTY
jgi:hypothetical protein